METSMEDDSDVYQQIPAESGLEHDGEDEIAKFGPNPYALAFSVAMIFTEWIQMIWISHRLKHVKFYFIFTIWFATVFVMMTLINRSNPGLMPMDVDLELYRSEGAPAIAVEVNNTRFIQRWCVTCRIYKSPRVKHCYECGRCIKRFDHHCQWLSNCIGEHNYKLFVNFWLFYSLTELVSLYYILKSIKMIAIVVGSGGRGCGLKVFASQYTTLFLITIIAFIRTLFVLYNTLGNAYFISKNITYYEYLTRQYCGTNPFDAGFINNVKEFWSLPWIELRQ
uniref:Palmitoyltransferase n=1 Tax=Babesia bovis TaxID=5865 RepID=S6BFS6_BABBO|nr:hypothetical protein [Babesia bovis]